MCQEDDIPITPEIKCQTPSVIEVAEPASSELTSDSDLSYVNFYDVENSQIYKKTKNSEQVTLIEAKILPEEPVINMPSVDTEKSDMNGNLASEKDKHPTVEGAEMTNPESPVNERKIISKGRIEDRPNFIKATPSARQRTLSHQDNSRTLKRFNSESDLLDNSFDKPPTVISKKKDNTLISKIYQDPNVRNFALSNRNQLPVKNVEVSKPPLRNQLSVDANVIAHATNNNVKQSSYNSDNGLSPSYIRNKSYYSSDEDLSSNHSAVNESIPAFKGFQNLNVRRNRLHSRPSVSSEDGLLSDSSTNLDKSPRPKSTRGLIYSSSEDLLSIDEIEKVPKRKDNTLISKIYQDPNVRNFALASREYIPVPDDTVPKTPKFVSSSAEDILSDHSVRQFRDNRENPIKPHESNENYLTPGISLDSLRIEEIPLSPIVKQSAKEEGLYERKMTTPDPDIDELVKKKIVHNILGQFTKSQPNLATNQKLQVPRERKISMDSEEVCISVKDLKKKFENNDVS